MAKDVFNPEEKHVVYLANHSFDGTLNSPTLPGHFAADTVEVEGERGGETAYAVFTVDEPVGNEYPHEWVGTYRIGMSALKLYNPELFRDQE